jgi:multiple sugar transport system ATP-binding protein
MKITIKNLTKIIPARKKTDHEVTAVNDMCTEIPSEKLVVYSIRLLGPSGCGKSTTIFMLSGLEEPTSGSIFFGDDDVTDLAPEKIGIGLVFQNYALYPHMTVEQNIMYPLTNMRIPKEEPKQRAFEAAGLVQIEELMGKKPSEPSGGQQQ